MRLAAKWSHLTRGAHYDWLREDPTYRERFDAAMAESIQSLEDEARRRAEQGTLHEIRYKGRVVGHQYDASDMLMAVLLKANRPEKYADRSKVDMTVSGEIELRARLEAGRQRAAGLDGVAQAELPGAPILERMVDVVPVLEVVKNPEKRDDADILTQKKSLQSIDVSK